MCQIPRKTRINSIRSMKSNIDLEKLELKYLNKIQSVLNSNLDNILSNLLSMNKTQSYWKHLLKKNTKFDVGAERIVYSILQRASDLGEPNSTPFSSDLFFENKEAYIHIDLKTCQPLNNLSDHWRTPVGVNQNSYKGKMNVHKGKIVKVVRNYNPNLPKYYFDKPTLTYFITILYAKKNKKYVVANINLACMPNGQLFSVYGKDTLAAGKNIEKTRFLMNKCFKFKKLANSPNRVIILYEDLKVLPKANAKTLSKNFLSLIR